MNYYKVLARCGHVKKGHYIEKWFYVEEESKKEAAQIIRNIPRVKHHKKKAIEDVRTISFEEYLLGLKAMGADPYFKVHNSTDQRRMNAVKDEDVKLEEESVTYKKSRMGQRIRFESYSRELEREFKRGELYEQN